MNAYQNVLNLLGRLLIVSLFLPAGLSKVAGFGGTLACFATWGIPAPGFSFGATIIIEIFGSIALLIGYKTRPVAIIMAAFTLAAAVTGHAYWAAPEDAMFIAQLLFFKNIAVMGGLLVLASAGAGGLSIDGRKTVK